MTLPISLAVQRARRLANLSQRQLALKLECPRTWISKIENGHTVPTLASLLRIADALNTEGWRLLKWAEEEQEKMVRAER